MEADTLVGQIRRSVAIAKKNVLIYYLKGPVVIFGLIMPVFLFLAFYLGSDGYSQEYLVARLIAMTVFFTAAAVSPVIIPLEAQTRTLERLATYPVATWALILGDIMASFTFCLGITCLPVAIGLATGISLASLPQLFLTIVIGALCFSAMGLLFSAPRFNAPSDVMMIAAIVKFSMVFISGVFVPLSGLPDWGWPIALLSPLTYFMDLVQYVLQGSHYLPVIVDVTALVLITGMFILVAMEAHKRTLPTKL